MTEQVRYRVDSKLLKQANEVLREIGMTPSQAVAIFLAQVVKIGGLPFRPSKFPVLEEYGATLADAEVAEAKALNKIEAGRKEGKVVQFTGKLG
jgi:addiction module RelB/DinJ family antitoxin